MNIRIARPSDHGQIWEIFHRVIETGDTFPYDPETPRSELESIWFSTDSKTYVADFAGILMGTYVIKPSQPGLGSHVASVDYMVHPVSHGMGVRKAMYEHSLEEAKRHGFKAMQLDLVVSTNKSAVEAWKKYGFEQVGKLPQAFNHRKLGLVDAYVMHRIL